MKKTLTYSHMMAILLVVSLGAVGVFHDYVACFFGAAFSIVLAVRLLREKRLRLSKNLTAWAIGITVLSYGLSVLWAVDPGMAFVGFLKILPVGLFLVLLMQEPECKENIIRVFPGTMAVLTVLSTACSLIPGFGAYFLVADRLAGTVQYPNTFALLLLVGQLILVGRKKWNLKNILFMAALLLGLLYTGSRTVFALAVPMHLILALTGSTKKQKIWTLGAVGACAAGVLVLAVLSDSAVLGRFVRYSFKESTFAGRLLYWQDALPLILKRPFGLGYWGYYSMQQSVQSGVYATVYIHNDLLQLMLDVGWIPTALLVAAVVQALRSKALPAWQKIALVSILLHSCFDFDLQFGSVFFLLLLFLDTKAGREKTRRTGKVLPASLCATAMLCAYMGTALMLPHLGQSKAARTMYAPNTQNNMYLLLETEDPALADQILEQNPYILLAHSVRARTSFSRGDFASLITQKQEIFRLFPFQSGEYIQYCQMLLHGIRLYAEAGDMDSVKVCVQELLDTKAALQSLDQRLSPLGRIIADQPVTRLPQELEQAILALEGGQ